jgi:hypothetical protein
MVTIPRELVGLILATRRRLAFTDRVLHFATKHGRLKRKTREYQLSGADWHHYETTLNDKLSHQIRVFAHLIVFRDVYHFPCGDCAQRGGRPCSKLYAHTEAWRAGGSECVENHCIYLQRGVPENEGRRAECGPCFARAFPEDAFHRCK